MGRPANRDKLPFGKFFWSDYASDPALMACSLAAQGLWMRMLCIAAEHHPVGYVAINGRPCDDATLARLAGASAGEVTALRAELLGNGVSSVDRRGWTFSRRMIRDAKRRDKAKIDGKKGGNPTLLNKKEKAPGVKGRDKQKTNPHIPEARDSDTKVSGADAPGGEQKKRVYDLGRTLLKADGTSASAAGAIITKLLNDYPLEWVLTVLEAPTTAAALNKISWIKRALQQRADAAANQNDRYDEIIRRHSGGGVTPQKPANALPDEKKRAIGEEA